MSWEREYRQLRRQLPDNILLAERRYFANQKEDRATDRPETLRLVRSETLPELFDYQQDLADEVQGVVTHRSAALLSLPTGGGKTRTGVVSVLTAMASGECSRVAWLAPSVELLDQAIGAFRLVWKDYGSAPDISLSRRLTRRGENRIWLTTPQAVYALMSRSRSLGEWDVVLFDEAHQLGARTYKEAVRALMGGARTALVGLSATPGRTSPEETSELVELFGGHLLRSRRLGANPVAELQRRGVLAQLRFRRFSERDIGKEHEAERLAIAAKAAQELHRRGRHVLVFSASVAGAYLLQDILNGIQVPAQAVEAGQSITERTTAIDSFAARETAVLINQRLLATGYDCPAVTDVFLLAEIGSAILFEQMVGRAARGPRTGGSRSATVWEFDDHLSLHGLPSSYYRYRDYDWS